MSEAHYSNPAYVSQVAKNEVNLATTYIEGPAMAGLTPDLTGKDVLSIACGAGAECERFSALGAASVLGVDRVPGLIDIARQEHAGPGIEFQVMDMRNLQLPDESRDFAYSSKAMHYVEDWRTVLDPLRRILRPGGSFLLSAHHPVTWGMELTKEPNLQRRLLGYEFDPATTEITTYGSYLTAGPREEQTAELTVSYYHKPLSDIFREIRESGFNLAAFEEPGISDEVLDKYPRRVYEMFSKFPLFMVMLLEKVD